LPHAAAIISVTAGVLLGGWIRPESFFITIPVSLLLLIYIPSRVKGACEVSAREIEESETEYAVLIQQAAHGIVEAQLYGYLDERIARTSEIERTIWEKEENLLRVSQRFQFIFVSLMGLTLAGLALLALRNVSHLAHVQVTMLIFLPLVMFEAIIAWYPNLFAAGKMILARIEIANIEMSRAVENKGQLSLAGPVGKVEVKNVQVAWKTDAHFMAPVSFTASSGECVVIRGRSGTGKSTFALGLLGLLDYEGSIRINDVELRDLAEPHLYIAGEIQSGHIFNTSLRENMKIAAPNAEDREISDALALVELDSLLEEMPEGLDTPLGALGRPLSGGETKRLNLARALLSSAPVLVLDEPTEHLDEPLASRIEERILSLRRILIVITHSGWTRGSQTIQISR
jgi:ABC-type transport system involved in cytochrome bd biosynthesis fused ATPase/permease subunit